MKRFFLLMAAVLAMATVYLSSAPTAYADPVSATPSSFGVLQGEFQTDDTLPPTWAAPNSNADRVGAGGATNAQRVNQPVWGFTLPTLPVGDTVDTVDFGFTMASAAVGSGANFTAVISLMNYDDISNFSGADYVTSVSDLGNGTLVATFDNTDVENDSVESFALTGDALTLFQSFYTDNTPNQTDVWFRISYDNDNFAWEWFEDPHNRNDRYNFLDDGTGNVTRSLTINMPTTTPGDFDLDGDVDGADFLEWQRSDGTPAGLTAWQNNYGAASPLAASSATVPEPSGVALVILAAAICSRRRIVDR